MRTNKGVFPVKRFPGLGIFLMLAVSLAACRTPARRVAPPASPSATRTALTTGADFSSGADTPSRTPERSEAASPTLTLPQMMAIQTIAPTFGGGQPGGTRTPPAFSPGTARFEDSDTPSRTPRPSRTPTPIPTITSTRWVATDIPLAWETPTWLPTPPSGAADYQLKAWDETAALGLVEIAEQYSYADNIPMPWGMNRFDYQANQAVVSLAAQEARHRFPQASFKRKLEWRIALADTIQDNAASDAWILQQIEDWLNSGKVAPESLDQLLIPFGFQIGQGEPAPNLFGDGRTAQVLWITRLDWGYTGLYAALRQDDQGRYSLVKIRSTWNFNFGSDAWYEDGVGHYKIEDHTGDGVPEVIFNTGYHNGSFCGYDLVIFQWGKDSFVDASRDQFQIDVCNWGGEWMYGTPGENGAEPIETRRPIGFGPRVIRYQRYEWNGEFYELSQEQLEPPEEFSGSAAQWVIHAMHEGDYATVLEKVQGYLADEKQREKMETGYGSSYPDYLRFQLGLAYAFQADSTQAQAIFEQIALEPVNPLTTIVSQAAQAYLDNYSGDANLYRACQAALKVMEKASGPRPSSMDTADYAHLRQVWGYQPDWSIDSLALCNLDQAFYAVTAQLDGEQFATVPAQLTRAGVSIRRTVAIDLDQDGQVEWVLLANTPGDDMPLNLWVLLKTAQGAGTAQDVVALPVVPWNLKHYGLSFENAYAAGLSVRTVVSPDGTTVAFIRTGEFLYTIQLEVAIPSLDWALWAQDALVTFNVYPREAGLELQVTRNTYYCKYCTDIYRWEDQRFQSYDAQEEQSAEAEAALLVDWNPGEAIPLLKRITRDTAYYERPRLLYLLGLAYELAGDEGNAAQAYWQLWREHPESPYALLAQAKLDLKE